MASVACLEAELKKHNAFLEVLIEEDVELESLKTSMANNSFGASYSNWKLCSPANVCISVACSLADSDYSQQNASKGYSNNDNKNSAFLERTLSLLAVVTLVMAILLFIMWESMKRSRETQERILELLPKLMLQLRTDLHDSLRLEAAKQSQISSSADGSSGGSRQWPADSNLVEQFAQNAEKVLGVSLKQPFLLAKKS